MYRLRELYRKDIPEINNWRNDADLIENLGAPFRYINLDVDINWYEVYMNHRDAAVRCVIVDQATDQILGLVSLTSINYINRSADFHIMIGKQEYRNKGVGTFAVCEMLSHAFYNMNLHRVELTVLENNIPARHLYEKCGFVKEGIKRLSAFKNGEYVNMFCYSILREEFVNKCKIGGRFLASA